MRFWQSVSRLIPRKFGKRYEQEHRLTLAYRRVFAGNPSRDDQAVVLADLLKHSGHHRITLPSGDASSALWFNEGKRAMYSRISSFLTLSDDDVAALENAARYETVLDEQTQSQ